jgi:P27 family predicted phage terminase small subunit
MPGPPPQPAYLKLLRGNPGRRSVRRELEPQVPQQLPEPPPFLSEDAKREWLRLIEEMVRLKLVTTVDTMLFACYCQSFAHWRAGVASLNQAAAADPETRGLLVKDADGVPHQNPLVRVVRNAADIMLTYAREFGLTPVSRARIAGGGFEPAKPPSKFDGLLR